MSSWHIGLSVGDGRWGGFSIGLGGLGFTMGISGSGCYLQDCLVLGYAVFLIPKVSELGTNTNFFTSANLGHFYNGKVAL
jgi:SSS family solute:Na+ symporter